MNFIQPQRQPSLSRGTSRRSNGSLPVENANANGDNKDNNNRPGLGSVGVERLSPKTYANNHLKKGKIEENSGDNANINMMRMDSHDHESKCNDPPIFGNYDCPDENDNDAGSVDSGASQRARRRQLREIAAQSDDCWEANLSDDEKEALPLQWNASMVRRQMMRQQSQRGRREDAGNNGARNEGEETMLPDIDNMQHTPTKSNKSSEGAQRDEEMSLPEILLQKRLRRKERLHRKHEQFVRYQRQNSGKGGEDQSSSTANNNFSTPRAKNPSVNHLTGNKSDICSASSPLFPDEDFDDDNASTVASSNGGASSDYSYFRSSSARKSQAQEQHESEKMSASAAEASPLHSLPQRPICPFPNEADRKRIVGCLAGILASSYPYETAPHLLVKERKLGRGTPIVENATNAGHHDSDEFGVMEGNDLVMDESFDVYGSSFDEPVGENWDVNDIAANHPDLQQHRKQQQLFQQSKDSRQQQRSPTKSNSFTAVFQKNRSHSSNDMQPTKPPPASNPMASLQHSFSFASFNNNTNSAARIFDKPGSQNPTPALATELAEIRHRIRRHAILSELLVSSAEMLMLDPSHAKAFLPMLETLLTKVEVPKSMEGRGMDRSSHSGMNSATTSRQSWKGRGFGGGGVPNPDFHDENSIPPSAMDQRTPSAVRGPPHTSQLRESAPGLPLGEDLHQSFNNADLNTISEKSICEGEDASKSCRVSLDVTSSRSRGSVNEKQSSCTSHSTPSYAPLDTAIIEKDLVAPFLQTLTPGAGFRCIALLLLNHLLRDGRGYDARVRQAFKRLAVIVISHELKVGGILRVDVEDEEDMDALLFGDGILQKSHSNEDDEDFNDADELARLATRKFEAMEHAIAAKLISMSGNARPKESSSSMTTPITRTTKSRSNGQKKSSRGKKAASADSSLSSSSHGRIALAPKETPLSSQHGISKQQLLRGIKVGTAGAVGATLFALTGGLAAPGIAAGLAAVAGTSVIAAGVSTVLSSAAAITTIFGVGGAGLASYKMHRRTKGLTEFNFHKETAGGKDTEAELFSTVCISGWLRDARDFQRPWGVNPSHPRIIDKQELLERFYFIYNPSNIFRVGEILKHWKGRYFQLWRALRDKYGRDPSNLYPLSEGPRISAELTHEEGEAVDCILDRLGLGLGPQSSRTKTPFFADEQIDSKGTSLRPKSSPENKKLQSAQKQLKDSSMKPKKWLPEGFAVNSSEIASTLSLFSESETNSINDNSTHTAGSVPNASSKGSKPMTDAAKKTPPKHLLTVWDYQAHYGGELYTVQWESELLMELCDSVTDQMIEWGISATKTILHTTVFATLMTAVTLPYSLVLAANAIDSSWTMAMERADRAGRELARSLIDSTAGHRPVILAGFSMGARVIYSCLKELARHQEIWEAHQQKKQLPSARRKHGTKEEDQGEDKLKYIREPASIVEDVILMGTPNHVSLKSWEACRRVVAGRVINCYSRKDLILSLMFQMKRFQGILRPVCGTSPVAVNGVENYDVTDLVTAHTDYCLVSGEILRRVRHGQPQTASESKNEVSAMVTTINVANKDIGGLASLSDETAVARGR